MEDSVSNEACALRDFFSREEVPQEELLGVEHGRRRPDTRRNNCINYLNRKKEYKDERTGIGTRQTERT